MTAPIKTVTDLKALPNWIVFDQEPQPAGKKPKKVPYTPGTNHRAKVNDPTTWRTYTEAAADAERTGRRPGCAITPEMNLSFADIDGQTDHPLVAELASCTERSINGGLHIFVRGRPPVGFTTPPGVELHPRDGSRFVLITENYVDGRTSIEDRTDLLATVFPPAPLGATAPSSPLTMHDDELLARAFAAANGAELQRLLAGDLNGHGNDHSAADLAAASKLAFWTQDPEQITRIIGASVLGSRDKWQKRPDYQRRTVARALHRSAFYTPPATSIRAGMPEHPPEPTSDPCAPVRDELAELRAENAALKRQLAERYATIAAQAETIAAMAQTVLNPNLSHTHKMTAVAIASTAHAKRASGEVLPDDRVVLSTADISDDHRPKPEPGDHLAPVNPKTGTKPRMSRSAVRPLMEDAITRGLVPAEVREVKRTRANGAPYQDWEFVVDPGASLATLLNPWAHYRPEQPKQRKARESRACPHCGEVHPIKYVPSCAGCGAILTPDDTALEATPPMGDKTSPIESVALVRNGRTNISHSDPVPFTKERREQRPDRSQRRESAAADLALREPAWLTDALDPPDDQNDTPQPVLFDIDDRPPGQSFHFSAE